MMMVFPKDSSSAALLHSLLYQSKENPFQLKYGFEVVALKEPATTTKIGKNKNKYTVAINKIPRILFCLSFVLFFIGASLYSQTVHIATQLLVEFYQ